MGKKTSPVEKCSYSYVCSYTQNILCISFFLSTSSKKKIEKELLFFLKIHLIMMLPGSLLSQLDFKEK